MFNFFKKRVVTRIAPSPTGFLHLGTARTALFNYIYARKNGGKFILRIEDTDKERSKKEYEKSILDGLRWLGLPYDELYRQSERTEIYKKYLDKLVKNGKAYVSKESDEASKRTEVIRLKNPGKDVTFRDEIRGDITFNTGELGNFVIAKSLDEPLYHFAVVVDDYEMGVTHLIRGEDHISNTPRQILIAEALGAPRPVYAHLPLILAPDRSKLSKRHGAVSLEEFRNDGYLPEAMISFLALLGWSPQGRGEKDEEVLTISALIKKFELSKVGRSGSIFNIEKLNSLNKEYLKLLPKKELAKLISASLPEKIKILPEWSEEKFHKIIPILIERIVKIKDVAQMAENGELDYFFKNPAIDPAKLFWKKDPTGAAFKASAQKLIDEIKNISDKKFSHEELKKRVTAMMEVSKLDKGSILWPMRYALSGMEKSPDPFTISSIIGKERTVSRLNEALGKLK